MKPSIIKWVFWMVVFASILMIGITDRINWVSAKDPIIVEPIIIYCTDGYCETTDSICIGTLTEVYKCLGRK